MRNRPGTSRTARSTNFRLFTFAPALLCALILAIPSLQAQTLHVLYQLADTAAGGNPNGLILDAAGNLYGSTAGGPTQGGVFELKRQGSNWVFESLYNFKARDDGSSPRAPVVFGPDGALYGTTLQGNFFNFCWDQVGPCGTVFSVKPPSNPCGSALCSWNETHIYWFGGTRFLGDGYNPSSGPPIFDSDGNIYDTTTYGGLYGKGIAYEMVKTQSGWAKEVLDNFQGNDAPGTPYAGLTFDSAGNLYGTAAGGQYGLVYELVRSGQGWDEKVLYRFQGGPDGANPIGGLTFDAAGNAYGTTYGAYQTQQATVFELSPQADGTWRKTVLELLPGNGPITNLTMDAAGNLYGTTTGTPGINDDHNGMVFKLSQVGGSWTFTQLHEFAGGDEGVFPSGSVAVDAAGNVYGSCVADGANGWGTIWEITP